MNTVYLPQDDRVEDLVSMIEDLFPGKVTSRLVLEVTTEDKTVTAFLAGLKIDGSSSAASRGRPAASGEPGVKKPVRRQGKKQAAVGLEPPF